MPAAIAVPLVMMAVSTGASIYQSSQANKKAKKAQKEIDDYQRQDLQNAYENLQTSTLSADRQREDLARQTTTTANLASAGGSRAIASLTPQLLAVQNQQEAQIVGTLDQAEQRRQELIAQGQSQVQAMTEQRENNDLLGLGNNLAIAQQQKVEAQNQIMQSVIQGAGNVAMGAMSMSSTGGTQTAVPTKSAGVTTTVPSISANTSSVITPSKLPYIQTVNRFGQPTYQQPSWAMGLNGTYGGF